ncbi:Hypothetical protein UVM_LOCUS397 [uncultured virus]|nr:Hypothetical protein UVM_LOCUS397 [uncultured virus]
MDATARRRRTSTRRPFGGKGTLQLPAWGACSVSRSREAHFKPLVIFRYLAVVNDDIRSLQTRILIEGLDTGDMKDGAKDGTGSPRLFRKWFKPTSFVRSLITDPGTYGDAWWRLRVAQPGANLDDPATWNALGDHRLMFLAAPRKARRDFPDPEQTDNNLVRGVLWPKQIADAPMNVSGYKRWYEYAKTDKRPKTTSALPPVPSLISANSPVPVVRSKKRPRAEHEGVQPKAEEQEEKEEQHAVSDDTNSYGSDGDGDGDDCDGKCTDDDNDDDDFGAANEPEEEEIPPPPCATTSSYSRAGKQTQKPHPVPTKRKTEAPRSNGKAARDNEKKDDDAEGDDNYSSSSSSDSDNQSNRSGATPNAPFVPPPTPFPLMSVRDRRRELRLLHRQRRTTFDMDENTVLAEGWKRTLRERIEVTYTNARPHETRGGVILVNSGTVANARQCLALTLADETVGCARQHTLHWRTGSRRRTHPQIRIKGIKGVRGRWPHRSFHCTRTNDVLSWIDEDEPLLSLPDLFAIELYCELSFRPPPVGLSRLRCDLSLPTPPTHEYLCRAKRKAAAPPSPPLLLDLATMDAAVDSLGDIARSDRSADDPVLWAGMRRHLSLYAAAQGSSPVPLILTDRVLIVLRALLQARISGHDTSELAPPPPPASNSTRKRAVGVL